MSKKLKFFAMVLTCILLSINQVWGATATYTWTFSSGDQWQFSSNNASPGNNTGTATLNGVSWSYDRGTAVYLGTAQSSVHFGSSSGTENPTFTCSAFSSYTITGVSIKGSSYKGNHKVTISVGGNVVKTATSLPSPTSTPSAITTGTISKTGNVVISFSNGTRALYLQEISITYETGSTYTLTFLEHDGGGTASGSPSTGSVSANATSFSYGATAPSKTGYKVEGFYTNTLASSGVKVANSSREFVASVGGWTNSSSQYTKGDNANLYIKWQAKQAAITFDKNGGSGGADGTTATYGSAMTTVTVPTRTGYNFAGYYDAETDNDGSGNKYYNADGTSAANWNKDTEAATTLYAKWTRKTPTVGEVSGEWAYGEGMTIALSVSPTDIAADATYQWKKYNSGTSSWDNLSNDSRISGATSASLSITNSATSDAGQYKCTVNNGGQTADSNTPTIKVFNVQFYNNGTTYGAFTIADRTAHTLTGYMNLAYESAQYGFKINDNATELLGNTGYISSDVSGWTFSNTSDCHINTTFADAYTFVWHYDTYALDVTYPVHEQTAGKTIYLDNDVRKWSNAYYRIGHPTYSEATAMTKVHGTANLYKHTTVGTWSGFYAWQLANNQSGTGSSESIYNLDGGGKAITEGVDYQKYVVTSDITLTPTTKNRDEDGAALYNVTSTPGMKTDNVEISSYSHGTVTVTYDDYDGTDNKTMTTGNRDLAHTVILKSVTAVANDGYELTALTINGDDHTSGDSYTVTGATTITATFTAIDYTISFNQNGGEGGQTSSKTAHYGEAMPTTITCPTKDGYDFDGYWDGEGGTGTQYYTSTGASARNWDKTSNATLYAKWNVKSYTLTWVLGAGVVKTAGTGAAVVDATGTVSSSVPFGTALTAPVVEREGYTFTGWAEGSVATTMPSTATTYTATWSINSYNVHWFVNGSADGVTQGGTLVEYNSKAAMPASNPSVPTGCLGKKFVGWRASTIDGVSATDPGGIFKSSAASPPIVAETWFHAVFADGDLEEDVIDYDATSSTLASESTTAYHSVFNISGSSTDATYTIYSMGTGDDVALRWNKNGYLYTNTPPTSGVNVNSITITTTADKNITIYYDYRNSAYQSSSTVTATSSGYTFDMPGDYNDIQIHGTTSSTVVSSIVITYGSFSNYTTSCGTQYTITLKEGNDSPTGSASGTSNGTAKVVSNGTALFNFTGTSAPTGYEVEGYYKENTLTTKVAASDGTLQNGGGSGIAGWTNSSGQFIGDDDDPLYIKWQAKNITITWNVNGAGGTVTPTSSSYTYNGSTVALPTPTRSGYWFDGWYTDPSSGSQITEIGTTNKPSSDVTYYAHWTTKTYTDYRTVCVEEYDITLHDNNGGSNNGSAKVTTNGTSLTTIVAPTRAGYEVDYYKTAADGVKVAEADGTLVGPVTDWTNSSHEYTKGDDATMYAHWKYAQYDIAYYDKNSAAFSGVHEEGYPTKHTYNTATTLDSPTRAGYTFEGWYTVADCSSGKVSSLGATAYTSGPINLYANWTQNNWALTMASSVGGGAGTSTSDAAITAPTAGAGTVENKHYGDEITVTVSTPSHHTFIGWTSSNGGSFANAYAESTTFTMPDNATTVTANFTEDTKYTVTWYDNGDGSNTEQVYSGETTTFPDLSADCDMYKAAGWIAVSNPATEFTSETMDKPAATIYAAGATTSAITGNVTYKAVYRHKYYTNDAFVNGTTDGEGYYLYAEYSSTKYYKTTYSWGDNGFLTSTSKGNAIPVLLEKVGSSYYMRDVSTDKYYYISSGNISQSDDKSATNAYKWTFSTPSCSPDTKGDYKIVNENDKATKTVLLNSSGNKIKQYSNANDCNASYHNFYLEKAYYYKYSPTAACYDITVSTNGWERATWETLDGSHKLQGTQLTVTPACGYHITSVSITNGTFTPASGYETHDPVTFTIVPTGTCTFTVNFNTTPNDNDKYTISYLDGATTLAQSKINSTYECGSYDLPNGYNTASGAGGACDGWTFDGWTATNYIYGQMSAPSSIQTAGSSQTASSDVTWYAVYHKTFAAGDYFNILYGDKYIESYGSNQFNTTTTSSEALMFQLEDGYLYYLDKTTRAKKWVYFVGPGGQNVTVSDAKPSSNYYKTTFTEGGGTYDIVCNSKHLALSSDKVKFLTTASPATKPNASGFTAYYPKTDCAIETVTITFDAGAGNTFTSNSSQTYAVVAESGSTIATPIEGDLTYDKTSWTFCGWSASSINGISAGAPSDLIAGGGSYTAAETITLHAVYTQAPPDGNFDNTSGGKYVIWAEVGGINYYAKSNGQTTGKLNYTDACSQASIFELVETGNEHEYKIHIVGEAKYLGGEGCADANTDFIYTNADAAPIWTISENLDDTNGKWRVVTSCGTRGFVCMHSGEIKFGHYSTSQIGLGTYYDVFIGQCADYYTTNPNKTLSVAGDVLVTSTNGRMVMAKDQLVVNATNITPDCFITLTSNNSDIYFSETREVNIEKSSKPTTSLTFRADGSGDVTAKNIYVHYMPSVSTHGIEDVTVTITSPDMTVEKVIKVRHLPATFAIAAKVGTAWYALTGNMNGATNPKAIQIDVDESTWTAYAPDTCAYQLWPVKTTSGVGDRYQAQGEKVRFSAVNNETTTNAGLWANNSTSTNTINNNAAITAISSDPGAQYEWKIAATEVSGTWKYTLQMDQGVGANNNKLNIYRATDLVWGTYADGSAQTSEIYLLPISVITPFEFQVVEWYPTKMLIYSDNDMSETTPTIKIDGETVASTTFTGKGGKLYEVGNLTSLTSHPSELLKVTYTKSAVTYTAVKTIPVILSRCTLNVTAAPFSTLTKEVYSKTDLVVRDNSILTLNGTQAENEFYDVTIYPTAKISVPSDKTFSVHSLTFFGGIDEIYNGSSYDLNKYGVPQLSMKGIFKKKTVSTIDYVMRVDDSQMYSLALPYDVNLTDIKYWNGTAMTLGTHLWVSAYDGEARATGVGRTWIYEEQFESKFGAAKLTAGVGYTISAEYLAALGSTYSIIRMPMTSNIAVDASEAAKSVAVKGWTAAGAHDNNKGWNLVGNPYMVSVSGSTAGGAENTKLAVGHLEETGTGPWKWVSEEYRYVTIPLDNGSDYYQKKWADATLPPFKNFFLQVIEDGDLTFALASRNDAPARYLEATEREVEFEVLLSNDSRQDNMGLLIAEKYSPAYEINADLEKMIGSMSVYTIFGGYNLAYNALSPDDAKQFIPVGYVAPSAGEYTFSLDEESDLNEIDHIYLTDYQENVTVDLMEKNYSFTTVSGKNESRFALNATLKDEPETPTDIDIINSGGDLNADAPQKFIYHDKMYIYHRGVIYDATGKRVREINK